jgi:Amt family ammonium transporter
MNNNMSLLAAKVAVTTTLSAASSAVTATIISKTITDKYFNLGTTLNAALGGLVGITANCCVVDPWQAIIIGFCSCIVYMVASQMLLRLHIDDPLDAFPVHGACGCWGILATGIFATERNLNFVGYATAVDMTTGERFGIQLLGAFCIICWTVTMSILLFGALALSPLGMRVSPEEEKTGLDLAEHGGGAYYRRTIYNSKPEGDGGSVELNTIEQTDEKAEPDTKGPSGPN